jgi:hypothetical protein
MIVGMDFRTSAPTATAFAGIALLTYALAGCGGDSDDMDDASDIALDQARILGPGLGLSEWSDDGPGDRRVLLVADSEAASDAPADRTVTALVQICAPSDRAQTPAGSEWQLVLDHGGPAPATGAPSPSDDGSPPLSPSGRITAGECAFADVDFDVPAGSLTIGMLYHPATGGEVRWSWEPADTVT